MKVTPLAPSMGAEITGIDLTKHFNRSANRIDSAVMADIKAVWLERQLIVIRQQSITPEQQLRFAESLGEPDIYPFLQGLDGFPMITEVLKKETETVNFGGVWHSDTTYQSCPPMATVLYAKELPPIGGDTLFSNQYAAYEQLSEGLKRTINRLSGVNIAGKKRVSATRSERVKEAGSGIKAEQMAAFTRWCAPIQILVVNLFLLILPTQSLSMNGRSQKVLDYWRFYLPIRLHQNFNAA